MSERLHNALEQHRLIVARMQALIAFQARILTSQKARGAKCS